MYASARVFFRLGCLILLATVLAGCSGGGESGDKAPETPTFQLGGTLSGLDGTLVIQLITGSQLTVSVSGAFQFPERFVSGENFYVTVARQPERQFCTIRNGQGTISYADVDQIQITCLATLNRLESLGGGPETGIAGAGNLLFFGSPQGLLVADFTDPAKPRRRGFLHLGFDANVQSIATADNHVYVDDEMSGLKIVDVSNPDAPLLVGGYDPSPTRYLAFHEAKHVAVANGYAYLSVGEDGLLVIDVRNPAHPQLVRWLYAGSNVDRVLIQQQRAYALLNYQTVALLDISNPAAAVELGRYSEALPQYYFQDLAIRDEIVWVAASYGGLLAIDFGVPAAPVKISEFSTGDGMFPVPVYRVMVHGNHAYLSAMNDLTALHVLDIQDARAPRLIRELDVTQLPWHSFRAVEVAGRPLAVGVEVTGGFTGETFVAEMDLSNPTEPLFQERFSLTPLPDSVAIETVGDSVYIADASTGLHIVDVSNSAAPVELGRYTLTRVIGDDYATRLSGLAINGDYAFLSKYSGLELVNISNRHAPVHVASIAVSESISGVAVFGHYAYLRSNSGYYVVDVQTPEAPVLLPANRMPGFDIAVQGTIAYVAGQTLRVFDISDPVNPLLLTDTGIGANRIELAGDLAIALRQQDGVQLFDISNLQNPTEIGFFPLGSSTAVAVTDDILYVTTYGDGPMVAIDISNPTAPRALKYVPTRTGFNAVVADTQRVFALERYFGLSIFETAN
jgi:hypothetical protein